MIMLNIFHMVKWLRLIMVKENCFKIAIEIDQTVFIVSENKTGVVDVIGMPRAFAELASHPNISLALVFTQGQASRPSA